MQSLSETHAQPPYLSMQSYLIYLILSIALAFGLFVCPHIAAGLAHDAAHQQYPGQPTKSRTVCGASKQPELVLSNILQHLFQQRLSSVSDNVCVRCKPVWLIKLCLGASSWASVHMRSLDVRLCSLHLDKLNHRNARKHFCCSIQ